MFKNYFKIALRSLVKNRVHSLINIVGLSLAFLCSILLFLNAYFELSFDTFYKDKDKLFKVYHHAMGPNGPEENSSMPYPLTNAIQKEIPLVESVTRFGYSDKGLEYKGKKLDLQVNLVDEDFLKVFGYTIVSGNKTNPLKDVSNVILTEYAAKRIFGNENPIGKTVKIEVSEQPKELVVSAVIQDFPDNASVTFDVLARTELKGDYTTHQNDWSMWNHDIFVKLSDPEKYKTVEKDLSYLLKKNSSIDTLEQKQEGYKKDANGFFNPLLLLPIDEMHFSNSIGTGSTVNKTYIYTLLLISFFILAIACFNFINLNIARAFTRTKEVGVRKSLGASRKQIFLQVWGESLVICIISVLIGIIAAIMLFPYFNQLFASKLNVAFFYQPSTIFMLLISILIISLCAGGYPAMIISKLSVSGILKGNVSLKKPGAFRNSLIILQFTIACLLMACTLIAYKQFNYMREMPLGFNKEALISLPVQGNNGAELLKKFRGKLTSQTSIVSMTGSFINLGLGKDRSTSKWTKGFRYKGKNISTNWLSVDYDFLKTSGIKAIKGRDFNRDYPTDTARAVIVTESLAKQLGLTDPVGTTFLEDDTSHAAPYRIIGVIPDFHLYSAHEKTQPLTIEMSHEFSIQYILIKTKSNNPTQVMNLVETTYKELQPGKEFKGSFIDDNIDRWYHKEKRLSVLLGISSLVAVILSCLGLFALALLMIQQRIKEIGVRKVLGASVTNINNLLAKDFLKLVVIAIAIATPLAWWLMSKWLQDFPYHTTITWIIFVFVGLSAIFISVATISFHTIKAALANPVKSLRSE